MIKNHPAFQAGSGTSIEESSRQRTRCLTLVTVLAVLLVAVTASPAAAQSIGSVRRLPIGLYPLDMSRDGSKLLLVEPVSALIGGGGISKLWDSGVVSTVMPPALDEGAGGSIAASYGAATISSDGAFWVVTWIWTSQQGETMCLVPTRYGNGAPEVLFWDCDGISNTGIGVVTSELVIGRRHTVAACEPVTGNPCLRIFKHEAGQVQYILPANFEAAAFSADGTKLAGNTSDIGEGPFVATSTGVITMLPLPAGVQRVYIKDMSADGSLVLGHAWASDQPLVIWENGVLSAPPAPPMGWEYHGDGAYYRVSPDAGLLLVRLVNTSSSESFYFVHTEAHGWLNLHLAVANAGITMTFVSGIADGPAPGNYVLLTQYPNPTLTPSWQLISLGEPCTGTVQRLWTGAGSDSLYSNPENWQGEEPALGDNIIARYATDDIYVVHVDPASLYVEGYSVGAGDITFDLQGATSQLAPGNTYCLQHSMDVASGADESAVIRVEGGAMHTAASVLLGDGAGSDTDLYIGPGATFRAGETHSIYALHAARGENAQSSITVEQSGVLETSNLLLAEGTSATAAMTVNEGAEVKAGETVIAGGAGATSNLLVEDTARGGATGDTRFASDVLIIGKKGAGAMTVRGQGALLETFAATLGVSPGASGALTVDNSNWNHIGSAPVEIGREGAGTLLMQNNSRWNHTGEGSIVVGVSAASQATIESGSKLTVSQTSPQPNLSISHGAVYVTGMNSSIDAHASVLSVAGPGASLAISAGATATFAFGQLGGGSSDSTVSVTGAGSALSFVALGDLAGRQGLIINRGPLTVSAGAHLQSTLTAVASEAGNSASVTITGPGTTWTNTDHLFVGWGPDPLLPDAGGVGSVVVEQGAVLHTGGLCVGGSGTVSGASINCGIAPPLRSEASGIYTQELFISSGTVLDVSTVTFHPGAVFGGTGAWPGAFTNSGAVVCAGDGSLGNFTFGADYAQTLAGVLHIDLKSREDNKSYPYWFHESDQLLIAGAATLGGTLALSIHPESQTDWAFSQGVTPTHTILTAGAIVGEFDQVTIEGGPACRAELSYTATSVVVTLAPPCAGDATSDGEVNFADITSALTNWLFTYPGPPGTTGPGDANHDGTVDFADVTDVLTNWGSTCP